MEDSSTELPAQVSGTSWELSPPLPVLDYPWPKTTKSSPSTGMPKPPPPSCRNTALHEPLSAATPSSMSRARWSSYKPSAPSLRRMVSPSSKFPMLAQSPTTCVVMNSGMSTSTFSPPRIFNLSCTGRDSASCDATLGPNAPISISSSGLGSMMVYPKRARPILQRHQPPKFNFAANSKHAGRPFHRACKPPRQAGLAQFTCSEHPTLRRISSISPDSKTPSTHSSMTTQQNPTSSSPWQNQSRFFQPQNYWSIPLPAPSCEVPSAMKNGWTA